MYPRRPRWAGRIRQFRSAYRWHGACQEGSEGFITHGNRERFGGVDALQGTGRAPSHNSSRRKRMRKSSALALSLALFAGPALASNTGFKLNFTLQRPGKVTGNNWVSFPYFYYPNGNV